MKSSPLLLRKRAPLGSRPVCPSQAKSTGTFQTFQNSKLRMAQPAFQAMLTPSLAGVF